MLFFIAGTAATAVVSFYRDKVFMSKFNFIFFFAQARLKPTALLGIKMGAAEPSRATMSQSKKNYG